MNHTPGPWEVLDDDVPFKVGIVHEDHTLTPVAYDIQEQGDALVMAAAPDMYAVLVEAVKTFDERMSSGALCDAETTARVNRARAAVAKAEGR